MSNSLSDEDGAHGATVEVVEAPSLHALVLAQGAVSLPNIRDALRSLELTRASRPELSVMVIDALDVTRFGRGAVVEIARWIPRHGAGLERVVLVSTSNQLRTSVQALAACAPNVKIFCADTREAAIEMLGADRLSLTG